jgi:hypothetical protein
MYAVRVCERARGITYNQRAVHSDEPTHVQTGEQVFNGMAHFETVMSEKPMHERQ